MLNSVYKILAKTIQIRLQAELPEMIHEGQLAFLLARYILDTVLVEHETIAWAKESNQSLIMLKLNFAKRMIL